MKHTCQFEVGSPIDTVEICIFCGKSRPCEPVYGKDISLDPKIKSPNPIDVGQT